MPKIVKDPENNKYVLSEGWSKAKEFKKPFDHVCEKSGQTVLVHRLDMGDLLKLGIASEMDFMSKALMTSENKEGKLPDDDQSARKAVENAVKQAENYRNMEKMINLVVSAGVLEPKIHTIPEHEKARQEGLMYVDEIPWDDRMELFSVIFETEGLSTFREEQEPGVGNMADVPSVSLPADRPVDIRSDDAEGVLLQ